MQIVNARCWNGAAFELTTLAVRHGKLDFRPQLTGDVWDAEGALILPAFVNAHDHLELNHYPRTRPRAAYDNASQWASDMQLQLDTPAIAALRQHTFGDKARIGIIRNILSGVLTVVQHGDPKRELFNRHVPLRVLKHYRWAHSLYLAQPEMIQLAHRQTPPNAHFFIHLAEGTDAAAQQEYDQLVSLGCVDARTVLIHAVGMTPPQRTDAMQRGAHMVTCPSTNQYLLGTIADAPAWGARALLGSDSRLTAQGDFLDEIRAALAVWDAAFVWRMLHQAGAHLGLQSHSLLTDGGNANLIIISDDLKRSNILLMLREGTVLWGREDLVRRAIAHPVMLRVDGVRRAFHPMLARWMQAGKLREQGLEPEAPLKRRWWWN